MKSFQSSQLKQSDAELAARQTTLDKEQVALNSFMSSQKAIEEADKEERATIQQKINKFLASL